MQKKQIGIFIYAGSSYNMGLIRGALSILRDHPEYTISFCPYNPKNYIPPEPEKFAGMLVQMRAPELVEFYKNITNLPIVNIHTKLKPPDFVPTVRVNDYELGRSAANYYFRRGFRNFIYAGSDNFWFSKERERGFLDGVRAGKGRLFPKIDLWKTFNPKEREAVINMLRCLPKPIAIYAMNDENLIRFLEGLNEAKDLQIPDEVAILGTENDDLFCDFTMLPLSSIDTNAFNTGRRAADILLEMIEGKKPEPEQLILPPGKITTRQSTNIWTINDEGVKKAMHIIQEEAHQGLTADALADRIYLSRRALDMKFKKYFSRTTSEQIQATQLKRAKDLLAKTDRSLQFIADECGFSTQSLFTVVFKRIIGETPSTFRKRNRSRY